MGSAKENTPENCGGGNHAGHPVHALVGECANWIWPPLAFTRNHSFFGGSFALPWVSSCCLTVAKATLYPAQGPRRSSWRDGRARPAIHPETYPPTGETREKTSSHLRSREDKRFHSTPARNAADNVARVRVALSSINCWNFARSALRRRCSVRVLNRSSRATCSVGRWPARSVFRIPLTCSLIL